jgi:hypothetical protein
VNFLEKTWHSFDKSLREFIVKFYLIYLGLLYIVLLSLSSYIAMNRIPNVDWFFQLELLSLSMISFGMLILGCFSLCFGTVKLILLSKAMEPTVRLKLVFCGVTFPILMFGFAMFFLMLLVAFFK